MNNSNFENYNTCYNCKIGCKKSYETCYLGKCSFNNCNINEIHNHDLCITCKVNIYIYFFIFYEFNV